MHQAYLEHFGFHMVQFLHFEVMTCAIDLFKSFCSVWFVSYKYPSYLFYLVYLRLYMLSSFVLRILYLLCTSSIFYLFCWSSIEFYPIELTIVCMTYLISTYVYLNLWDLSYLNLSYLNLSFLIVYDLIFSDLLYLCGSYLLLAYLISICPFLSYPLPSHPTLSVYLSI